MIVSELIDILNTYDKSLTVVLNGDNFTFRTPEGAHLSTMILSRTQEYMACRGPSGSETSVVVLA